MLSTIYIICVDICAFTFLIFGVLSLASKKPAAFLWNKGTENIDTKHTKLYNKGVAILYIFLCLSLMVVGLVSNYVGQFIANILLLLVLGLVVPTLSYAYSFLVKKYSNKK